MASQSGNPFSPSSLVSPRSFASIPKRSTTPCSFTGSCRSPRKFVGLPYLGRPFSGRCCNGLGVIEEGEPSFGRERASFVTGAWATPLGRMARASADSGLTFAKVRKTRGRDDQPPNRLANVQGLYF